MIVDHSTANAVIGGTLKKAGLLGVVRYAAGGRPDVSITAREYQDLLANNIPVAIVLEHEADWLLHTATVEQRVLASQKVTRNAGIPDGLTYMAVDFDVTLGGPTSPGSPGDHNMQAVEAGLSLAAQVTGRQNVGFYGSKFAIDWLVAHGWGDIKFWQTVAWSHGQLHPLRCLLQGATSETVAGVQCDLNYVNKADWGQRVHHNPPPPPVPPETWLEAKVGICVQGPHKNQWRVSNLPFETH